MHIVLPGALPDADAARALLPQLATSAPTLTRWMALGQARIHDTPGEHTGCTPEEYWRLQQRNYQPHADQNQAAGLGPLLCSAEAGAAKAEPAQQALWLAELVHVSPTQHGASLLTAQELLLNDEQDAAFFNNLSVLQAQTPATGTPTADFLDCGDFTLRRLQTGLWQIGVPEGFALNAASPAQVARSAVNDWWPHQESARSWRRFFNEVQMLWFDHPVNQQRQQHGLPPVNGLWLFGGATAEQLDPPQDEQVHWHEDLLPSCLGRDWGDWLQALAQLDERVLRLADQQGVRPALVLTGRDRIVEVTPTRQPAWLHKLTRRHLAWRNWWSPQN